MKTLMPSLIVAGFVGVVASVHAAPRAGTLGTLPEQAQIPADVDRGVVRDTQNEQDTLRAYQQYLNAHTDDNALADEAKRRIADLELETADLSAATGGSDEARLASYQKAARLYRDLLSRSPSKAGNDRLLYQLARAEEGSGQAPEAIVVLDRLVHEFPQSDHLVEATFRRGELLFSQKRYEESEAAYTSVVAIGDTNPFFEQALYKQGWARLKQDDYAQSLDPFFTLLDRRLGTVAPSSLLADLEQRPRAERELLDDACRAVALDLAGLGKDHQLVAVLAGHGNPSYGVLVYRSLAAQYLAKERYSDAADVLMQYVGSRPDQPESPGMQIQAIAALEAGTLPAKALLLRGDFVHRFEPMQSKWQASGRAELVAANGYFQDSIWKLAEKNHADAQAATDAAARDVSQREAVRLYQLFLSRFSNDARAPDATFLLGDVLYEAGRFPEAIQAYESAAYKFPAFKRAAEAAFAALQVAQKYEKSLSGDQKAAFHRRAIEAELRFANTFSTRPEAQLVRANAAAELYAEKDLAAAQSNAQQVVSSPSANADAKRIALRVLGHSKFDAQDFAGAEIAYATLQQLSPDADVTENLAATIYKEGEKAKQAGQLAVAAKTFERVAAVAPTTKIRVTADYDAAMSLFKAGETAQAIPALLRFRETYSKDPLSDEVTRTLSLAYEQSSKTLEAGREFERLSQLKSLNADEQRAALWHSYQLFKAAKSPDAARVLLTYVDRYPSPFDIAIEARQSLIDYFSAIGQADAAAIWSARLVAFEQDGGANRTERSKGLAARASLVAARTARDIYRAAPLTQPLKVSLAAKRRKLEAATEAYSKSASYGVAEVLTESTFETAELYRDLAAAIRATPAPRKLDAEAREQYALLMDEQTLPIEDKAIRIHEANARRTKEGLYDRWIRKSLAALAELSPGRYRKNEWLPPMIEAMPSDLDPPSAAIYQHAVADLKAGRTGSAVAGFSSLIQANKAAGQATLNLALAYRQAKSDADEEKTLRAAIERWPNWALAQHQFALWARMHGQFDVADAAYMRAIAAAPKDAGLHLNRGILNDLYRQRPEIAVDEYERYQSLIRPPNAAVALWVADLRKRTSNVALSESGEPHP